MSQQLSRRDFVQSLAVTGAMTCGTPLWGDEPKETLARLFGKQERDAEGRLTLLERPDQELVADDLRAVAELKSLRQLNLAFCKQLKDDGLQHLRRLDELRELNLGGCKLIGDAGLEHLRPLKKLERLNLSVTRVGNEGLKTVAQFKGLKGLDLDNTEVTEDGLPHLAPLTDLDYLRLADLPITYRGVVHLVGFKKVKFLVMNGTELSDAGFHELAKLESLERFFVSNTRVSQEAVRQTKQTRPKLRIVGP